MILIYKYFFSCELKVFKIFLHVSELVVTFLFLFDHVQVSSCLLDFNINFYKMTLWRFILNLWLWDLDIFHLEMYL